MKNTFFRQVRRFEIHWASGIIPIYLAEYVSWMFPELLSPWGNSDAGRSMVIAYRSAIEGENQRFFMF